MTNELNGFGRHLWPNSGIFWQLLEEIEKIHKKLGQDSQCSGKDSIPPPPKCKSKEFHCYNSPSG
jgi:hypothetical protein